MSTQFKTKSYSKSQYPQKKPKPIFQYKQIHINLYKKYTKQEYQYTSMLIKNLIFNEKCHIVALFKDYLVYDDDTEFFRRYYKKAELKSRLTKIFNFYETYSKIFPNYMILPENEYLYKNIRKKQKMIDAFNQIKQEEEENRKKLQIGKHVKKKNNENLIFDQQVQNSINKYQRSIIDNSNFCYYNDNYDDSQNSISLLSKKAFNYNMNSNDNIFKSQKEDSFVYEDSLVSLAMIVQGINNPNSLLINPETPKKNKKDNCNNLCNNNCNCNNLKTNNDSENNFTPKKLLLIKNEDKEESIKKIHSSLNNNKKFISHKATVSVPEMNNNINNNKQIKIINNYHNIIIPEGTNTVININTNFFNCKGNNLNTNQNHVNTNESKRTEYNINNKIINTDSKTNKKESINNNKLLKKNSDNFIAKSNTITTSNNNYNHEKENKTNYINSNTNPNANVNNNTYINKLKSNINNQHKIIKNKTNLHHLKINNNCNTVSSCGNNTNTNSNTNTNINIKSIAKTEGNYNNKNLNTNTNKKIITNREETIDIDTNTCFKSPEKLLNTKLSLTKNNNMNINATTTSTISHVMPIYKNKNINKIQTSLGIQNKQNLIKSKLENKKNEKEKQNINNNSKRELTSAFLNHNNNINNNKLCHMKVLNTENDLTISKANTTTNNNDTFFNNNSHNNYNNYNYNSSNSHNHNHSHKHNFDKLRNDDYTNNTKLVNNHNIIQNNTTNNSNNNYIINNYKNSVNQQSKGKGEFAYSSNNNKEININITSSNVKNKDNSAKEHKQLLSFNSNNTNCSISNNNNHHSKNILSFNSQRKVINMKPNLNRKMILSPNNDCNNLTKNEINKVSITNKVKGTQKSPVNSRIGNNNIGNIFKNNTINSTTNKFIKSANQKPVDPNTKKMKFIKNK